MGIALGLVLAIAIIAVVVWPLFRPPRTSQAGARRRARELQESKAEIYRQIRQAEHDRATGLIEQADLEAQVADLRIRAARVIKQEAEMAPGDSRLEAEVAQARATIQKRGRPDQNKHEVIQGKNE